MDEFDVHLFRPSKVSQAFQQLLAQDVLQDHEAFTVKDLLACYLYFKTGYEVKDNVDTEKLKDLFEDNPHNNWYKHLVDFFPIRYELQRVLNYIDSDGLPNADLQEPTNLVKLFNANRPGGSTKACVQSLRAALDAGQVYDTKADFLGIYAYNTCFRWYCKNRRIHKIHTWASTKEEEFWTVLAPCTAATKRSWTRCRFSGNAC